MSKISLKDVYDQLIAKGDYDVSKAKYKDLNDLKDLLNNLNDKRNLKEDSDNIPIRCTSHTDFSIDNNNLSLSKIQNKIDNVKALSCTSKQVDTCTCQSNIGCECEGRTPTCDSVVSYSPSSTYTSYSDYYCDCNSRTGYYCDCNSRTSTIAYYYCSCDSRLGSGYSCDCNSVQGSQCSCNSRTASYYYYCTCNCKGQDSSHCTAAGNYYSRASYDASTYYYYYYNYGHHYPYSDTIYSPSYYSASTYSSYSDNVCGCNSRTGSSCSCNSRTTTNPCACNTRTEALCASRIGCSCNAVCDCNTVKLFE